MASISIMSNISSLDGIAKRAEDIPDDDFNSTALSQKWSLVAGSAGVVSLNSGSTEQIARYDLSSVPGFLALQANYVSSRQDVSLRQDFEVPVGKSIIMKLFPTAQIAANLADEVIVGIYLNNDDSTPTYNVSNLSVAFRVNTDGWHLRSRYVDGAVVTESTMFDEGFEPAYNGLPLFLRVCRETTYEYSTFCSFNGLSWTPMRRFAVSASFNNLWILLRSDANIKSYSTVPIQLIDWIRLGSTDVVPW